MRQQDHYLNTQQSKMLALHLCSCNSDGLMLMADDLYGLISELSFGVLSVTGPEIGDPPLGTQKKRPCIHKAWHSPSALATHLYTNHEPQKQTNKKNNIKSKTNS